MLLDRFRVQPAEVRKFTIDYIERLPNGNTLAEIQDLSIDIVTDPPFAVSGALGSENTSVILYTSGGVSLTTYKLEVTVRTFDSQIWQDEVIYMVEDI